MRTDLQGAVRFLLSHDAFQVVSHKNPDGDTIGSAFALIYALRSLGKRASFLCQDPVPGKYAYLAGEYREEDLGENPAVVAVDLADPQLFGTTLAEYGQKTDLCIDHHVSNTGYAGLLLLDEMASATAELMLEVIEAMGVQVTKLIAECLYTGICTDTGCFRYSNVTAETYRKAAKLFELGVRHAMINTILFETKEKNRLALEQKAIGGLEYAFDDRMALLLITREMLDAYGVSPQELEGLSSLPRQIAGVEVGVTVTEQKNGAYKVSFRTSEAVSANELAGELGGGGHARAAGCVLPGPWEQARRTLLDAVGKRFS